MELKPGYKMTEVGVIPEDWTEKKLNELGAFIKGKGISRTEANSGILPCIRYGEIYTHHNNIIKNFYSFISYDIAQKSVHIKPGDILFTCSGETKEEIGKCVAFIFNIEAYAGGDIIILRNTSENSIFLGYRLNAHDVSLQKSTLGQGDAVVHISTSALGNINVTLPVDKTEQQAIAAALSDVDELLSSLDRLIAKKKDIRRATMQELLTGKKRLPGFQVSPAFQKTDVGTIPEDWWSSRFGDIIAKIVGGGTPKRDTPEFWGGDIPWATVKDFTTFSSNKTQEYITQEGVYSSATHVIPAGTLIIATRMALGKSAIYKVDVAINQDLKALFFKKNISTNFMHYWFQWHEKNIQSLGSGSTVQGVSIDLLKKISIATPSLAEQQAIASVLSDMDAEIEALEARRDKVRNIKTGMMQELLTGKTRLVSTGETA